MVSYKNPDDTLKTNIIGTFNLLKAIRLNKSVKSAVIVTTDKVYLNDDKKINLTKSQSWVDMICIAPLKHVVKLLHKVM